MRAKLTWAVLSVAVIMLAGAAQAHACGYRRHADAIGRRSPGQRDGLVIGDSTMILATAPLGRRGLETDAKECRQFGEGVAMVAARRSSGTLPHLVVMALGANGPVGIAGLEQLRRVVGRTRVLALVTPPNLISSASSMRTLARRHPDQVLLIDWKAYSAHHRDVFDGDGIHPTTSGAQVYADFIAGRAAPVYKPPPTLRLPPHSTGTKDCGTRRRFGRTYGVRIAYGRQRISCRRARELAAQPPLQGIPGWAWADGAPLRGPWLDVFRRRDRRVVVATLALTYQPTP